MRFMIKGHTWEIVTTAEDFYLPKAVCGYTDFNNRKLFILNNLHKFLYLQTLLHELIHAIGFEYNIPLLYGKKCNEKLVDKTALVIASFIFASLVSFSDDFALLLKFIKVMFKKYLFVEDTFVIFTYTSIIHSIIKKGAVYYDKRNTSNNKQSE